MRFSDAPYFLVLNILIARQQDLVARLSAHLIRSPFEACASPHRRSLPRDNRSGAVSASKDRLIEQECEHLDGPPLRTESLSPA